MIYLEMYGRLGNQMFRYAAARSIQMKYYPDEKLVINFNQIKKLSENDESWSNELISYNICDFEEYTKDGKALFQETAVNQKILCLIYYLVLKRYDIAQMNEQNSVQNKFSKILNQFGVYWYRIGYTPIQKSNARNKFISGSFEDPKYFIDIREVLLNEFTPKFPLLEKNQALYQLIKNCNSICVSVRRGDFESNPDNKKLHSVCDRNYFEKAINLLRNTIEKPVFFMFSDDIEWVRQNIETGTITYYEDGTDPVWEKLRLMSSCKHFIISNSTFSWWAQWLSKNNNKVVVSPKKWYNNDFSSGLIDSSWILL